MPESLPLKVLPFRLDSFDWDRFESFCLSVVRVLPEVKRADRYGITGESQKGIDIEAELHDGRKRTIQCRHRRQVTAAEIKTTFNETTYAADEHEIWLTCPVGTNVSDYIAGLDGWTIQSDEGVSQKVRLELPREKARLIVRDAFGAQVARDFLGPGTPVGFVSPDDYFAALDDHTRLLRHDLPLVGRKEELDALVVAAGDALVKVVVVPGRGGIGKTRLLRGLAERLTDEGKRVLYSVDPALLTAEVIDDLPLEDTVVFVDDAHRADVTLAPLMATTLLRADPLTLVLGTRPAGRDQIDTAAANAQLEPHQIEVIPPLEPLAADEVEELAACALDERSARGRRLADATDKLPLLTVLGGGVMARGDFGPDGSPGGEQLRAAVLQRFVAEQRGRVTPRIPEDKAHRLLVLLAALNPIDTADETLLGLVADELGVAVSQLRAWLGEIQHAGLFLTRGALRRLSPDVLADEVLYGACLDRQERSTGRAAELWRRYAEHAQTQLLANLGELDWRTTSGGESLLDEVWARLLSDFREADSWDREQLIARIAPAAFFWPTKILELVDIALSAPARTTDWVAFGVQIDDGAVRDKLPALLKSVGRHPTHARAAMDRLWLLAREDERETHSHPDHALRALRELGGFDFGRAHHEAMLGLIEAELDQPKLCDYPNSPLLLLEALLACEGTDSRLVGLGWKLSAYFVDPRSAGAWRDRVRRLLVDQAVYGQPRERTVAAKLLAKALELPHGYFGHTVPGEVHDAWKPDQEATFAAIDEIAGRTDDAAVRVGLIHALEQHSARGPWEDLSQRAAALIEKLQTDAYDEVWAAIASPWDLLAHAEKTARDERVARLLRERCDSGAALANHLEDLLAQIADRKMTSHADPAQVLFHVFSASRSHAAEVWEWAMEHPDAQLAGTGALALNALRHSGDSVDERLERAATSTHDVLRRSAADYLCSGAWFADPSEAEVGLLEVMARDDDSLVRNSIAIALLRLGSSQPELAVMRALKARIDPEDQRVADMLFSTIQDYGVEKLSVEDIGLLCHQLRSVSEPGHFAHKVLADLGRMDPQRVIDLWIARLQREQHEDPPLYRSIPFDDYGVEMLGDAIGEERTALHAAMLVQLASFDTGRVGQLGEIYWRLALPGLPDDAPAGDLLAERADQLDAALTALDEHLAGPDPQVQNVGHLLAGLPWQVLFTRVQWVASTLESDDAEEHLAGSLRAAAYGGACHRTVGEDSPRWTGTLAGANAALNEVDPVRPAAAFYADLAGLAQREIDKDRREDDERRAGWQ